MSKVGFRITEPVTGTLISNTRWINEEHDSLTGHGVFWYSLENARIEQKSELEHRTSGLKLYH